MDGKVVISTALDNKGLISGVNNISGSLGGLKGVVTKLAGVIGAAFSVAKIIQFGAESSKAARQLSDALVGLKSVIDGNGRSFSDAQKFLEEYTADGLIPAANATTAYKNLLSRGYDDSQIKSVMNALKDASAYGRQSSYTMGEAVQGATEGLKNENSILVDNAGVTKNVAKMWEEYAASIGTTASNLTQQQKIQAEVTGILAESKYQTGDAAKAAGTLSGQLQQLSFNFNNLKVAIGNAINPILQAVLPALNAAISGFTRLANSIASVMGALFGSASVTSAATSSAGAIADANNQIAESASAGAAAQEDLANGVSAASKAAKRSLAGFDELNKLQDQTAGGGGGSGGSGGDSSAKSTVESVAEVTNTLTPKIQAVIDKINDFVAPLKEIDFSQLSGSFKDLREAFQKLGKSIADNFEWYWFNVLVPLGEWTIEEGAPRVVETLAGAFELLGSALDTAHKVIQDAFPLIKTFFETNYSNKISEFLAKADFLNASISGISTLLDGFNSGNWETVWKGISEIAVGEAVYIETLISGILSELGVDVSGFSELVDKSFSDAWSAIESIWKNAGPWFQTEVIEPLQARFEPLTQWFADLFGSFWQSASDVFNNISVLSTGVKEIISAAWERFWINLKTWAKDAWEGIKDVFAPVGEWFGETFGDAWQKVKEVFSSGGQVFDGIKEGIVESFKAIVNSLISGINRAVARPFEGLNNAIRKIRNTSVLGMYPFSGLSTVSVPTIPYLAQGAVLPANKPFMAVVGDQRHGTNVEAPLSTIQEAVALVMNDQLSAMMAGFNALLEENQRLRGVVENIELGDTTIGQAANRYQQRVAIMMGG